MGSLPKSSHIFYSPRSKVKNEERKVFPQSTYLASQLCLRNRATVWVQFGPELRLQPWINPGQGPEAQVYYSFDSQNTFSAFLFIGIVNLFNTWYHDMDSVQSGCDWAFAIHVNPSILPQKENLLSVPHWISFVYWMEGNLEKIVKLLSCWIPLLNHWIDAPWLSS